MNKYKYKIDNFILDLRITNALSTIQYNYNSGKYMTKTEYALELKNTVSELYKKAGMPTFVFHKASDVPSYIHYKDMFTKAIYDLETIINCSNALEDKITKLQDESMYTVGNITDSMYFYEMGVVEIENRLKSIADISSSLYTDNFTNTGYVVGESTSKAYIKNGTCMLHPVKTSTYSSFDLSIGEKSNGFPGNTHEVFVSTAGYTYVGITNPRLNLKDILSKNEDRWFEFEMFNIDGLTKIQTSSLGFKYKEGISWISVDNQLNLYLNIEFELPAYTNVIYIKGLPRLEKTSSLPVISEVVVYDDFGVNYTIHSGKELDGVVAITFPTQYVKSAVVKITQNDTYLTDVARVCIIPADKMSLETTYSYDKITNVFDKSKNAYINIEEDSKLFSIEYLGLRYDMKTKKVIYPSTKDSYNFMSEEYRKNKLFHYRENDASGEITTQIIKAHRYVIGISNIFFEYNEYVNYSTYVSKEFYSEKPITRIVLNTSEHIPKSYFLTPDDKTTKEGYIEYYVSLNEESEWHQIYSRKNFIDGPCCIMINSSDSESERNKNVKYIDRLDNVHSVRLQIKLRKHSKIEDETPVVNSYSLNIDTI